MMWEFKQFSIRRWISLLLVGLASFLGTSSAAAQWGASVASGYGAANIVPLRIGIQKQFPKRWRTDSSWPIYGYWEGSLYHMNGKKGVKPDSHKQLNAAALAAVARIERAQQTGIGWPYVEIGFGASWVSKTEIGGRDLGIHFQFEDRIGLGFRFGDQKEYDIGYKAIHFSNAYIGPSNHGINLHVLTFNYWFS